MSEGTLLLSLVWGLEKWRAEAALGAGGEGVGGAGWPWKEAHCPLPSSAAVLAAHPETLLPIATLLSQPARPQLPACGQPPCAFECWAGLSPGGRPGLGRSALASSVSSLGPWKPQDPMCSLAMLGRGLPRGRDLISGFTVDLICPGLIDPGGKLAGKAPGISVGFQDLSGADRLRTGVGN